jgi:YVTN family beta-propeller protein
MCSKADAARLFVGIAFAAATLAAPQAHDRPVLQPAGGVRTGHTVRDGIAVEYGIEPAVAGKAGPLRTGDDVIVRFRISDDATKTPLTGAQPAAWLYRTTPETSGKDCPDLVRELLSGNTFVRAETDLNAFYVLAMNEEPTITVVDPLFGYGNSHLLAMIGLQSPGDDWALEPNRKVLFVSMPASNRVAVIDTLSWRVIRNLDVPSNPRRIALQPDGGYLWVAFGTPGESNSGVAAISTSTYATAATIRTGAGVHDLAISDDSRYVLATNSEDGTVSVIDVRSLTKTADIASGRKPVSVTWSSRGRAAYVVNQEDGTIAAIDPRKPQPLARVPAGVGISRIRFEPKGRFGFVVNPSHNEVLILDSALNRVVQRANVESEPDQVTFSEKLAYVRHAKSEIVEMIPLDVVNAGNSGIPVLEFPAGQRPLGEAHPSSPDVIVEAPGEAAVLVANSADRTIYYYKEGMAAPMGSYSNYSQSPRAVLVVDRSLKQRKPGGYETSAKLGRPGPYLVAFFLDTPRFVHCFEGLAVEPGPASAAPARPRIETSADRLHVRTGETVHLRFHVVDADGKKLAKNAEDIHAVLMLNPGIWHDRRWASPDGTGGFTIDFVPPRAGFYSVSVECPSLGIPFGRSANLTLQVDEASAESAAKPERKP